MSFEPIPQSLEQDISQFAKQQHIGHDEAILMLIKTGLSILKSGPGRFVPSTKDDISEPAQSRTENDHSSLIDDLSLESRKATKRRPRAPQETSNPEAIIGAFANLAGFREAMDAVISRRAERYGRHA